MTKQMTVDKHLRSHLKARAKFGSDKYGVPLLPFNGRNPLKDKREELLDALVYNEQDIMERETLACELEEVHGYLYNFRQTREIQDANLDRAIAALKGMAEKLSQDTERIEPKDLPNGDYYSTDTIALPLKAQRICDDPLDHVTFGGYLGPDTPPAESRKPTNWLQQDMVGVKSIIENGPAWMRQAANRYAEGRSVPLEPVLESIRKDGPIGHRDLMAIAQKEDEELYNRLIRPTESERAAAVKKFMEEPVQHPAMERLEKMECSCCGKCVQ